MISPLVTLFAFDRQPASITPYKCWKSNDFCTVAVMHCLDTCATILLFALKLVGSTPKTNNES